MDDQQHKRIDPLIIRRRAGSFKFNDTGHIEVGFNVEIFPPVGSPVFVGDVWDVPTVQSIRNWLNTWLECHVEPQPRPKFNPPDRMGYWGDDANRVKLDQ